MLEFFDLHELPPCQQLKLLFFLFPKKLHLLHSENGFSTFYSSTPSKMLKTYDRLFKKISTL